MRIKRLSWKNYKGLADGSIEASGSDVLISGRNGSGKSTLAEMMTFIMSGKVTGSLKRYDGGLKMRDGLIHGARIEFEDGTVLSRGITDASSGGTKSILSINGEAVAARRFDSFAEKLTNGGGELVWNPFAFVRLSSRQQRDLLLKLFGKSGVLATSLIAQSRIELRAPKAEALGISARIDELRRQVGDLPTDVPAEIARLEAVVAAQTLEMGQLTQEVSLRSEYECGHSRLASLSREREFVSRQLEVKRSERAKLLTEYRLVRASVAGQCPTCGQRLPLEHFEARRDEKLLEIITAGKEVVVQITGLEKEQSDIERELMALTEQVDKLKARAETEALEREKRLALAKKLQGEIAANQLRLTELKSGLRSAERIEELKAREKVLNRQIVEIEGRIAQAEENQQRRIRALEAAINGHFEHVRFKLFDALIDGTPRETCEAMIDGVPYTALSKGEKLKAALDIFKGIQRFYGVEMPLMIDDAESYTANSFVELPNQKFYFRVTEGELLIEILEGRRAA